MRRFFVTLLGLALLAAGLSETAQGAVTEENFNVKTTADLVALCAPEENDPMATNAVIFCHGYAVGVYQTFAAQQAGMQTKMFCVSNPAPTRTEAIAAFVSWAKSTPAVLSDGAPDAILRYLTQRFPCTGQAPSTVRR